MKTNILIIFLLIGFKLVGQKTELISNSINFIESPVVVKTNIPLPSVTNTENYIKTFILTEKDNSVRLLSEIKSLKGVHYTYIQTYQGLDVYQGLIKINTDLQGQVVSIFNNAQDLSIVNNSKLPLLSLAKQNINSNSNITESKLVWIKNDNGEFEKAASIKSLLENGLYVEEIFNGNNERILENELSSHFSPVDTIANALVYRPDPLTVANTEYGGTFVDNNDQTNPDLDSQRDSVEIELIYENGEFILENENVKIVAISAPLIAPTKQTNPDFYFDRSQLGFEEVNVLYHITQQQKFIKSLGFTNVVNYAIDADCHGFNGADNSAFNPGTNPPSIIFGQGGVDDAEDADVIIHEYTHAIMHSAAPGTSYGSERKAMEEAFGDYMAASYSSTYDIYHNDFVFSWDGHNEYWPGRMVTSNDMYPTDLNNNLYLDAPMWSSALMRIEKNIGREETTTIAIESGFSFTANMTMAQAAQVFLQTDTLLYNGANYAEICWVFKDKGMILNCSVSRPNDLVGISGDSNGSNKITIANSENFASGSGNLVITSNLLLTLEVFDLSGKLIYEQDSKSKELNVNPANFKSGTYIYKVTNQQKTQTFKIIKF